MTRTSTKFVGEPAEEGQEAEAVRPVRRRGVLRSTLLFLRRRYLIVLPFVLVVAIAGYYYYQYNKLLSHSVEAQQAQAQEQIKKVVGSVEKLMYISDTSGAQLATITDITKLKGQKFFDYAQNGDDLVLFPQARQAVLYRPSTNKIIQVGPFDPGAVDQSKTTSAPTSSSSKSR